MNNSSRLSCRNIWQLYGKGAKRFLERHDYSPSLEQINAAGLIGAVRDVSFELHEQEILMIMGLSGSGKSTIIRCLTRLIEPTAGQVLFDGQDLLQAPAAQLMAIRRHKMGMVFQHFGLLPHRTVLENIAFPLEVQGVDKINRIAKARELVHVVGLDGREDNFPRQLSGGQQQRVGIARSLAVEPDIWFLDEPFSALDPLIRTEMQDEFVRLQQLLHKSIVFVTHDFEEAVRLGDRIAIMKDGVIVQIGTAEDLVTEPADDYVEQFVKNAPKPKLISVYRIMGEVQGSGHGSNVVNQNEKLQDVAARIMLSETAVAVSDDEGNIIGSVNREQLVNALFQS